MTTTATMRLAEDLKKNAEELARRKTAQLGYNIPTNAVYVAALREYLDREFHALDKQAEMDRL